MQAYEYVSSIKIELACAVC